MEDHIDYINRILFNSEEKIPKKRCRHCQTALRLPHKRTIYQGATYNVVVAECPSCKCTYLNSVPPIGYYLAYHDCFFNDRPIYKRGKIYYEQDTGVEAYAKKIVRALGESVNTLSDIDWDKLDNLYSTENTYFSKELPRIQKQEQKKLCSQQIWQEGAYDRFIPDIRYKKGFDRNGLNRETGTKYDKNGYDIDGYDINGIDRNGHKKETYEEMMDKINQWDYD